MVGGVQAEKGRYPYMVSILTAGASEGMPPACGGSLIGKPARMGFGVWNENCNFISKFLFF